MITLGTKKKFEVVLTDSDTNYVPVTFYTGNCEHDAEKMEACLEMCVTIVEAITDFPDIVMVSKVFSILEENGHAPDVHIDSSYNWEDEARSLYAQGRRIAGIKLCRQHTGSGLKAALDYCDANFWRPSN